MEIKNIDDEVLESIKKTTDSERISELKKRTKRCVCSYCGGKLVIRRISAGMADDGRVEIFCENCNRIEYGTEPEIFQAAKYYVSELKFDYYSDLDDSYRKQKMNIAKACEIMQWCCRNLGTVTEDGFTHPEEIRQNMQTSDIIFSAADLKSNGDGVHGQGH